MTSCPTCGGPFVSHGESTQTCMGGIDSLGHGHNPNATMREYVCANGHRTGLAVASACDRCDYRGVVKLASVTLIDEWPPGVRYAPVLGYGEVTP